ncbi:MAG: transcriptional regulator [Gemmiger sp.]|nr:transcriptional regulator [Gemmiger sp.]
MECKALDESNVKVEKNTQNPSQTAAHPAQQACAGQTFGRWQMLGETRFRKGRKQCLCRCTCGTERYVDESNLLTGKSRSCGCLSVERAQKSARDLTGRTFGRLTVEARAEKRAGRICWRCRCECGSITVVAGHELLAGKTQSCGCLRRSMVRSNQLIQDIKGVRAGYLVALCPTNRRNKKGSAYWKCLCTRCGNEVEFTQDQLLYSNCKSCGCLKAEYQKNINQQLHFVDGTCIEWLEKRKSRSDNTSGFRGVTQTKSGRFCVAIGFRKKKYYLGTFYSYQEAVDARLKAEEALYGAFVEGYRAWLQKAETDKQWAETNPYVFSMPAGWER